MENEILLSNEKFELAQENFDEGNFNNAIAYCKQSLSLNPKNFQAMLLLGKAYLANWDDEAFKCFDLVKQMQPNLAEGYFYKGRAILRLGNNYKKAIADFDKAIELEPNNAETYFLRGDAQARLKNFSVAITFANLKNKKLALEHFDKFLALSGEKKFYDLLGEIYFALEDYEKAVENFSKHLEIESYDVETYYLRGRSYFEQKNFAKALADFEKYVSTMYELMSDGCYFSEGETNYAEAKNFCDLCKKNLEG